MNTAFPVKLLSQLRPLLIGFRKSKGLTQKELSARLGVTQQTYVALRQILQRQVFSDYTKC
jgi:HTH-type transcriptional regulator/antitoxin HipB